MKEEHPFGFPWFHTRHSSHRCLGNCAGPSMTLCWMVFIWIRTHASITRVKSKTHLFPTPLGWNNACNNRYSHITANYLYLIDLIDGNNELVFWFIVVCNTSKWHIVTLSKHGILLKGFQTGAKKLLSLASRNVMPWLNAKDQCCKKSLIYLIHQTNEAELTWHLPHSKDQPTLVRDRYWFMWWQT